MLSRTRVVHFVKRPGKGRKSFAITRRETTPSGKRFNSTIRSEELASLNAAPLPLADKELQAEALCRRLNEEQQKEARGVYVASAANLKLLSEYWKKEYEHRRIDKSRAQYMLRQAVEALGPLSLLADRHTLQRHMDQATKGSPSRQRRFVAVLNQMRRHFGVTEKLSRDKPSFPEFKYLNETDFACVLKHVEQPALALLFQVLFYSGVRTGEAMALRREHYRNGALLVMSQVDRRGTTRGTKTGNQRRTAVFHNGQKALLEWLGLSIEQRDIVSRNSLSRVWKAACKAAFPRDPSKHTCVHDLRHSYAVEALTVHEVSVDILAKLLGNSATVCETYYLRFTLSDDLVAAVLSKANRRA